MKSYLELNEMKQLEEAATCYRDQLLIRLLFHAGCRISEALALKVGDIHFEQGTVTILHLKSHIDLACAKCGARLGQQHKFCPTCGIKVVSALAEERQRHRIRTLPVDADTLEMLTHYIKRGGPVLKNGEHLVFGITRHRAWQIIRECAEKASIPPLINPETGRARGISPHRLRDAFAVHAVKLNDSGDGLRLLQEHLGHASFNTTARYRKVGGSEHRDWYQKLWNEEKR